MLGSYRDTSVSKCTYTLSGKDLLHRLHWDNLRTVSKKDRIAGADLGIL